MTKAKQHILLAIFIAFIISCNKGNDDTGTGASMPTLYVPTIVTTNVLSITSNGADVGGIIQDTSLSGITASGICYSESSGPTVDNGSVLHSNDASGDFTLSLTNLTVNKTYYVRAYATNSSGTGYGNEVTFMTDYALGQSYNGGIIFFIDHRGHGKIVAASDVGTAEWGCIGTSVNAMDSALGAGSKNTDTILAGCSSAGIAARLANSPLNGYNDWFLPSSVELNLIYSLRRSIGNFADVNYWTSTEYDANQAYFENFAPGSSPIPGNKSIVASVRPIRVF